MLEVSFEVSDGRTHQRNEPGHDDRALVSVVTVNLGGLRDLSKGLATRRERDLDRVVLYLPI
jgi:hypothetical protein